MKTVLATLQRKATGHKRKRSTKLLEQFHQYTSWLLKISGSVDVAVNTSAGIACPIWTPMKFLLMICTNVQKDGSVANESSLLKTISERLRGFLLYS
jgi:hypothetical protein